MNHNLQEMSVIKGIPVVLLAVLLSMCGEPQPEETNLAAVDSTQVNPSYTVKDEHSYANPAEAAARHLDLDIKVDFEQQIISGVASYDIEHMSGDKMIFDAKGLEILKVTLGEEEQSTTFDLGANDDLLGQPLTVQLQENTTRVNIHYSTTTGAEALQWLNPQQTAGKQHPYLFTQGQAILTRTWIPCQDTPGLRVTYNARVEVPKDLLAVMSATNPTEKNAEGIYEFEMKQSIPIYLMALAVGDLSFQSLGEHTGVYTEPSMLEKCAYELADVEKMLVGAEALYGPYRWERYDVIVLPPSFPFGGMENPRLTFATPTIIAGDRSLTTLIAHELAHSWSGNLVTNATWNDFWLNEGFTVYFERRIMEALYGKDYAEMLALLGQQDLKETVANFESNDDTKLKLNLDDRSPDDGMTDIAYEKGAFFLRMLEEAAGREHFDAFLKQYFEENAFSIMTTEMFIDYLQAELIDKHQLEVDINEWVYTTGLPENCAHIESERFAQVEQALTVWSEGADAASLETTEWSTHEWLHFLRHLPREIAIDRMENLDQAFGFTNSGNSEILAEWYQLSIQNSYAKAYPGIETFLVNVGRRKFLVPLYRTMVKTEDGKAMALAIYKKARANYHAVSTNTLDKMLGWQSV